MKVLTSDQMRQVDRNAESIGLTTDILMENAGRAVAEETVKLIGDIIGKNVLVLVGPGNNGGDGLVAARYLNDFGADVFVYLCSPRQETDKNYRYCLDNRIPVLISVNDTDLAGLSKLIDSCEITLDAIFGTGMKREVTGIYKQVLSKIIVAKEDGKKLIIISIDIPSGMDADNGAVDPVCPKADATITLGYPKTGLYNFPGAKRAGKIIIADIGIPPDMVKDINTELISEEYVKSVLPNRSPNSNKSTFGKILVIAGSINYTGAAYLACMGAFRCGAGLVTLATGKSLHPILAVKLTEATHLPLPEAEEGIVSASAFDILEKHLTDYRALLIGCGLGQHAETVKLLQSVLFNSSQMHFKPVVLDADALNALASSGEWWHKLGENVILTPHPGEMARLTDMPLEKVQKERVSFARNAASDWQKIVVLKGAYTIIAAPDGRTRICPFANAALASAGTGDVLAGIIAGLVGQNMPLFDAAVSGVFLHATAGLKLAEQMGDAGVVASDLLNVLPLIIKDIKWSNGNRDAVSY